MSNPKFDSRKIIVEATLAPIDQLAKNVDENYSTGWYAARAAGLSGTSGDQRTIHY
jgi:hypothetical protein